MSRTMLRRLSTQRGSTCVAGASRRSPASPARAAACLAKASASCRSDTSVRHGSTARTRSATVARRRYSGRRVRGTRSSMRAACQQPWSPYPSPSVSREADRAPREWPRTRSSCRHALVVGCYAHSGEEQHLDRVRVLARGRWLSDLPQGDRTEAAKSAATSRVPQPVKHVPCPDPRPFNMLRSCSRSRPRAPVTC